MTLEALLVVTLSLALVKLCPFRWSARLLTAPPAPRRGGETGETSRAVSRAVRRVKRHLPLTVTCLAETVAASLMLGRRGIPSSAFIGVRTGEGGRLDAHAWLVAEGRTVAGGGGDGFRVITRYERVGR